MHRSSWSTSVLGPASLQGRVPSAPIRLAILVGFLHLGQQSTNWSDKNFVCLISWNKAKIIIMTEMQFSSKSAKTVRTFTQGQSQKLLFFVKNVSFNKAIVNKHLKLINISRDTVNVVPMSTKVTWVYECVSEWECLQRWLWTALCRCWGGRSVTDLSAGSGSGQMQRQSQSVLSAPDWQTAGLSRACAATQQNTIQTSPTCTYY